MDKAWLCFKDEEALLAAILAEIVPRVARAPATLVREERQVWLRPRVSFDRDAVKRLQGAGVEVGLQPVAAREEEVGCWAEALTPSVQGELGESGAPVLLLLPREQSMLDVAGEMLRLGCQQQSFCALADGRYLVRVVEPPYYTLARAFDEDGGLRAFVPLDTQEQVWLEAGFSHPLAESVAPEEGAMVLIGRAAPWDRVARPSWEDIHRIVQLEVPEASVVAPGETPTAEIKVPVTLSPRGGQQTPTLWVLRKGAEQQVEELLRGAPQSVLDGLTFAVSEPGSDEPLVVLRSRPARRGRDLVTIDVEGEPYVVHEQLRHLYLPQGTRLDPPLRRDTLRDLLAPSRDHLVWLRQTADGFTPETIPDTAFEPVVNWVEYVVGSGAEEIKPWVASAVFRFDTFEGVEEVQVAQPKPKRERKSKKGAEPPKASEKDEDLTPPEVPQAPAPKKAKKAKKAKEPVEAPPTDEEALRAVMLEELRKAEGEFLELDDELAGDHPDRIALWARLAQINSSLGRTEEAGLCWTRAIWSSEDEQRKGLDRAWMNAEVEAAGGDFNHALGTALDENRPSRDATRLVAAILNNTQNMMPNMLLLTQRWLEGSEENLDLRALWLAHSALSRLAGGDSLGLARCRDRTLARLHRGLSVEREVPSFLRRLDSALVETDRQRSVTAINDLILRSSEVKRKKMPTEAPVNWTFAYVRYIGAYAMAKLAREDLAQRYSRQAHNAITGDDEIHGMLSQMFQARIEQALAGQPAETPLPQEILQAHNDLDQFLTYKVDRMRLVSEVLEPSERLEPTNAFLLGRKLGGRNLKGAEFDALQGVTDGGRIAEVIADICAKAEDQDMKPTDRARLFIGALDFFPHLSEAQAFPHLTAMVEHAEGVKAASRVKLLEKALVLAGHFGQEELAERLAEELRGSLVELKPDEAKTAAAALGGMLKTLWRLGMQREARAITEAMEARSKKGNGSHILLRVHLGVAYSILGLHEKAQESHEEAMEHIAKLSGGSDRSVMELLRISRALAWSLAAAPRDYAFEKLAELEEAHLPNMTDSFNTNSHFCLAVIGFIESLIIGYTGLGETVGRRTRRWLDEDEFLVRQRIHQDMKAAG